MFSLKAFCGANGTQSALYALNAAVQRSFSVSASLGNQLSKSGERDRRSSDAVAWRSAFVLSMLAALISAGLNHRFLPWQWSLPALAFTFEVSFLAMLPGLVAAYALQRMSPTRNTRLSKRLLDFWLPAVVGLVTFDGYVTVVTGRSSLFYLNLIVVKRAYRWLGSGGTDANVLLFLPLALAMLMSVLLARWLHAKLRYAQVCQTGCGCPATGRNSVRGVALRFQLHGGARQGDNDGLGAATS